MSTGSNNQVTNLSDDENDNISEVMDDIDLPVEFYTFGRQIVQELCVLKDGDKQLLPNYFARSRFRSLSTLHKKRCVDAWNALTAKQREDIKTKLKIPDNIQKPPAKTAAVNLAIAQHASQSDDESFEQLHSSEKLVLPDEVRRYGREIIRELCTLKGPDHQPLLPHSYARTKFRSLRDGQKKKVVDVWSRLLTATQRNQIMAKIQVPITFSGTRDLTMSGKDNLTDDSEDDGRDDEMIHLLEEDAKRGLSNKDKDAPDAIRRRLNDLTATAVALAQNSSSDNAEAAVHESSSTNQPQPSAAHNQNLRQILAEEDSEADFAVKILNCALVPADMKEIAIKQLRSIQRRKIKRRFDH